MSKAIAQARKALVRERDKLQVLFDSHAEALERIEVELEPIRNAIELLPVPSLPTPDSPSKKFSTTRPTPLVPQPSALIGKTEQGRKEVIQCIGADVKRGVAQTNITKEYGISMSVLRRMEKEHGWERPPTEKVPLRVCEACQQRTRQDPCGRCGTAWDRGPRT